MNMKKLLSLSLAALILVTASTAYAGGRGGNGHKGGHYGHKGGHYGHKGVHHRGGHYRPRGYGHNHNYFPWVLGGVLLGAGIVLYDQHHHVVKTCWIERRPVYDAHGNVIRAEEVHVCKKN